MNMKELLSPCIGLGTWKNRRRDRNFLSPRAYIKGESSEFFASPYRGPWRSSKFFQVPGTRERLGIFSKSPGNFFERPFSECDVIKGGGVAKFELGVGENKDMKHANNNNCKLF